MAKESEVIRVSREFAERLKSAQREIQEATGQEVSLTDLTSNIPMPLFIVEPKRSEKDLLRRLFG
jgi:hypothetical protein